MSIPHGGTAVLLAAATKIASDHSIIAAVITATSGVLVVIIGPFVADWLRNRRKPPVDHTVEHEQELLHLSEHFLGQLEERDEQIERLRDQLRRRRR